MLQRTNRSRKHEEIFLTLISHMILKKVNYCTVCSGPWLGLMSLKNFRGPRYVADLGGPRWLGKNEKVYNIGQLFEGKNQLCSVII